MNVSLCVRPAPSRKAPRGFTLVEVLVTIVLITIAIVGVLGGIRSVKTADAKAQTADRLQRLATEKINDLKLLQDPSTGGTSGDFSDRGYPDVTWSLAETTTSVTNMNQITVTVSEGKESQALTTLVFIPPQTATTTATTATTTAGG